MMRVLDLFSGIGGFSLGLGHAGMETIAFCEIDPFCRKVLAKHWPDIPIHEDVRELDGREYSADVICGGYPCQGESLAGERRGADDDRWLWPEMFRLVKTIRPAWVIGENVIGHVTMGLDGVLSDLESLGYAAQTFIIPACAVDAPHRRYRVWIIANCDSNRFKKQNALRRGRSGATRVCEALPNTGSQQHKSGRDAFERPAGEKLSVADADSDKRHRRRRTVQMGWGGLACKTENDCNAARNEWPSESGIRRMAYGIPNRVDRLRGLGNAVVPQIPEIIGRAIMEARNAA